MKSTDPPIVLEYLFNTSIDKLWHALTNLDQMTKWYFENIEAFKPEVGFQTKFAVQSGERTFTHLWKVTEALPKQLITYTWKYKEYPGDAFVTFELMEQKNQVKLRLKLIVLESFPDGIPEFTRESCIGGWNYFLGERLKEYFIRFSVNQ